MNTTRKPASGLLLNLLAVLAATASLAQVERRTKAELQADREALPALQKSVTGEIAAHLGRIAKSSDARRVSNAVRVVRDACAAGVTDAPLAFYDVDPMSNVQYLPDAYPFDGTANAAVRIIAAGERADRLGQGSALGPPSQLASRDAPCHDSAAGTPQRHVRSGDAAAAAAEGLSAGGASSASAARACGANRAGTSTSTRPRPSTVRPNTRPTDA